MDQSKTHKRWRKRLQVAAGVFLSLVALFAGGTYMYLKSISIEDIAARRQIDTSDPEQSGLPALLQKPVEKASELLGGQTISGQDALDVAAILLQSGLSLKEIRYLQGNATYELTTEEKQSIRDLLLAKLSPEELAMLRQITKKYGKGLLIAAPDYPIEAVGETDPEKRKKIEQAWAETNKEDRNESLNWAQRTDNRQIVETTESPNSTPSLEMAGTAELTAAQRKYKNEIDRTTEKKLQALQRICEASSAAITGQIITELAEGGEDGLSNVQEGFLAKVAEAESGCDLKFQSIVDDAIESYEKEKLPAAAMPDWASRYSSAKSKARSSALASIASALP